MGDININDTNKNNNQINVTVGGSTSSVNLTADLAQFYANKAKKWAISPEIVDNEDYSAKYYANRAKNEASAISQISSQVLEISNTAIQNISEQTENSINTLKAVEEDAKNLTQQGLTNINNANLNALQNIQENTNEATEKIQLEGETQISNIKSTGFYMEDGKLYYIDENGEPQEFKSSGGTSVPLFAPVTMDHVLSFEESMGYALQGTYVYKTGVAGERYGYPDFIQKCIDEFNNYTNLSSIKDYINLVGSISLIDGVLSGFNSTSWAVLPQNFSPNNSDWKMFFKFTTGTIGTKQDIINSSSLPYQPLSISINNDGKLYVETFVDNTDTHRFEITGTTVLSANTTYYVSLEYDSTTGYTLKLGTNKNNMTTEGTSTVTSAINSGYNLAFGADFTSNGAYYNAAFSGSIDFKECYINIANELWWKGSDVLYINANGHMFYNISEKPIIDGWYEQTGTAWFYGVDVENERVFLPRNNWFEQMTGDVSKVGQFNPAGLPNITGDTIVKAASDSPSGGTATINPSGAFKVKSGGKRAGINGGSYYTLSVYVGEMDASLSSPVYGNSNTVQPPSVNKLLYIVVGNTSQVTNVTTTIPGSEVISQVNKNTTDIIELQDTWQATPHIVDTYVNGTSGYRIYSDGYCKQWGRISMSSLGEATVTLLKTFADTNYSVICQSFGRFNATANMEQSIGVLSLTTNSIKLKNGENARVAMWQAEGYLA